MNAGMLLLTALVCGAWWFWSKREPEVRAVLRRMARYSLWSPRRLATVFLAVAVGGLLLRSAVAGGDSKPTRSSVASPAPTVAATTSASPLPSPAATLTPFSTGTPEDTATRFVTTWANGTNPYWLTSVKMLVTARLAKVFGFTDPRNIPATKVTGPGRLLGSADGVAFTEVPTDAGAMAVTLVPDPADPKGWLVDGIEKAAP